MWVKICANTNEADALRAAELGADALGFVFAPSKRQVAAVEVREMSRHLPAHVERVGVFTSSDVDAIASAVEEAELTGVQMHGGLDLETAAVLRDRLHTELIHVVHWEVDRLDARRRVRAQLAALASSGFDERVLLDAKVLGASGGLGVGFDWESARAVLEEFPRLRVIVAGGLRPENVQKAVRVLRPYGVDVASGVEALPGRKDDSKLRSFIEKAQPMSQMRDMGLRPPEIN